MRMMDGGGIGGKKRKTPGTRMVIQDGRWIPRGGRRIVPSGGWDGGGRSRSGGLPKTIGPSRKKRLGGKKK